MHTSRFGQRMGGAWQQFLLVDRGEVRRRFLPWRRLPCLVPECAHGHTYGTQRPPSWTAFICRSEARCKDVHTEIVSVLVVAGVWTWMTSPHNCTVRFPSMIGERVYISIAGVRMPASDSVRSIDKKARTFTTTQDDGVVFSEGDEGKTWWAVNLYQPDAVGVRTPPATRHSFPVCMLIASIHVCDLADWCESSHPRDRQWPH